MDRKPAARASAARDNVAFAEVFRPGSLAEIRARMSRRVEDFVYGLLTEVFNAKDTAPLAIDAILEAGSHDLGPKASRIEDSAEWTEEKIRVAASKIDSDKGPEGDFDD